MKRNLKLFSPTPMLELKVRKLIIVENAAKIKLNDTKQKECFGLQSFDWIKEPKCTASSHS